MLQVATRVTSYGLLQCVANGKLLKIYCILFVVAILRKDMAATPFISLSTINNLFNSFPSVLKLFFFSLSSLLTKSASTTQQLLSQHLFLLAGYQINQTDHILASNDMSPWLKTLSSTMMPPPAPVCASLSKSV